jgi:hypothetical protein
MKKLIIASLVACLLLMTAVAHAEDRETAERYFRAGARAYAAQNFEAAATDFEEAYKNLTMPEIAFSAAQAYRRLYRVSPKPEYVTRAIELYRAYLDHVKTGGRVGDAADSLAEMQREADRLAIAAKPRIQEVEHTRIGVTVTVAGGDAPATGALREIGDVAGDAIPGLAATLDGKPLAPFALADVDAGPHVIAVTADGFHPIEKKLVAVAGQSQLLEVELRPKPASVTVSTEGGAELSIDGRPSSSPAEVAAGKHLLAIVHRGREPWVRELVVTRGQVLHLDAPLVQTGRRRAVPWLAAGTGIVAALAVTTGILALGHDHDASDLRSQIAAGNAAPSVATRYDDEVASRDHDVTATWILGGSALALGAATAALYWFDKPEPRERAIVPMPTAGGAGASVVGRW